MRFSEAGCVREEATARLSKHRAKDRQMVLILSLILVAVLIGSRTERLRFRHFMLLTLLITIGVAAQLAAFYLAPPTPVILSNTDVGSGSKH